MTKGGCFIIRKLNFTYNIMFFTSTVLYTPPRWLHLIVVRGFENARDPESYTSGSVATGRVSLAGQVKG
jgi:hypothetical protein